MIVDTSVVIGAIERRDPAAVLAIESMELLSVRSMFVLGELTFGVESATDATRAVRSRTRDLYLSISDPAGLGSLDGNEVAQWFGVASAIAQASGIKIGQNDRWIVAESLTHDVPVWTADTAMRDLLDAIRTQHDGPGPVFVG